jgi:hypothetical protein
MPWVRRPLQPRQPYWVAAVIALAAVCVGILIGYTRWGATAAVVTVVEKELTDTQARIKTLEKRMNAMESVVLGDDLEKSRHEKEAGAVKKPEAEASKNRFKIETGKQVWKSEPRL